MTEREQIEAEIRELLATETRTTVLSNKLFQQGTGLFAKLATTEDERRVLVRSELFRAAQSRVRDLEYRDADALREAFKLLNERVPGTDVRPTLDAPVRVAT